MDPFEQRTGKGKDEGKGKNKKKQGKAVGGHQFKKMQSENAGIGAVTGKIKGLGIQNIGGGDAG